MTTNTAAPFVSASLYVGDLSNDVTEALLFEIFNAVGPVASVRVCRDTATRRSLGYAYVNFHRVDDAERALDTMNFKNIKARPCRIMWSQRDPSLRRSGVGNIFVKNLAKNIDNKSLYDTFSMFGNILSCKVATNAKKESLGYAFVHYENEEAAQNAIQRVDGKVISGQKVIVKPFKAKSERTEGGTLTYTNLYVKNLPDGITKEDLDKMFAEHGTITSSHLQLDAEGKPRGFGFVGFETHEQAKAAVEALNGKDMGNEKILYVGRAQKKEERQKEMLAKFESMKQERQRKYAGVNLFVKNLAEEADDEKLRKVFGKFGTITSTRVMIDQATKRSKCFGFVCFSTPEEATRAVTELNGQMLDGKPLYVAIAQRKEHRRAQLEAQYSARRNGMPQNQMGFHPNGVAAPQMFYQGGMPQRNYMYPPTMMRGGPGRFMPGPGGPPMMGPGHQPSYRLMQVQPRMGPPQEQRNRRNNPRNQHVGGHGQPRQPRQQPQRQQQEQPPAATGGAQEPLTIKALAAAPEEQRKQMIGERLFPLIQRRQPDQAGKITGMLLEMDNTELLHLLENSAALDDKCKEAINVLRLAEPEGSA